MQIPRLAYVTRKLRWKLLTTSSATRLSHAHYLRKQGFRTAHVDSKQYERKRHTYADARREWIHRGGEKTWKRSHGRRWPENKQQLSTKTKHYYFSTLTKTWCPVHGERLNGKIWGGIMRGEKKSKKRRRGMEVRGSRKKMEEGEYPAESRGRTHRKKCMRR